MVVRSNVREYEGNGNAQKGWREEGQERDLSDF